MSEQVNDKFLEQVDGDLTVEVQQALEFLRERGFAVAAFTPSELRGADSDDIEDAMVQMGWDAIDMNATEPRPDEKGVVNRNAPAVALEPIVPAHVAASGQTDLLLEAFAVGDRVELHPATDRWMRGDRFGAVVKLGRRYVHVALDRSGETRRFAPENVILL
jgi:hypothetical protein